jgi:hypothetical protein
MENGMRFSVPMQENGEPKRSFLRRFNFKKILKIFWIVVIVVAVIALGFLGKGMFGKIFSAKSQSYSAVFLANGQVYFGKMESNNEKEIVLNNVFYIQVNQSAGQNGGANALGGSSFNLVKLGNELHGPTDELFVNRSQVVFYENLRDDSKVVESIKNYKK